MVKVGIWNTKPPCWRAHTGKEKVLRVCCSASMRYYNNVRLNITMRRVWRKLFSICKNRARKLGLNCVIHTTFYTCLEFVIMVVWSGNDSVCVVTNHQLSLGIRISEQNKISTFSTAIKYLLSSLNFLHLWYTSKRTKVLFLDVIYSIILKSV